MSTLAEIIGFLAEHADLIQDLFEAIAGGAPKDVLKVAIRQAKADAYWAALKEDLHGPRSERGP